MLSVSGLNIEGARIASPMLFCSRRGYEQAVTSSSCLSIAEVWSTMGCDKALCRDMIDNEA